MTKGQTIAEHDAMTQQETSPPQQTVLNILHDNTRDDYAEARDDRRDLARQGTDGAPTDRLSAQPLTAYQRSDLLDARSQVMEQWGQYLSGKGA